MREELRGYGLRAAIVPYCESEAAGVGSHGDWYEPVTPSELGDRWCIKGSVEDGEPTSIVSDEVSASPFMRSTSGFRDSRPRTLTPLLRRRRRRQYSRAPRTMPMTATTGATMAGTRIVGFNVPVDEGKVWDVAVIVGAWLVLEAGELSSRHVAFPDCPTRRIWVLPP